MGFGWLLIGYFFANIMDASSPFAFAKCVGYPMLIFGLYKLAHYHKGFKYCFYLSFLSLPFAFLFSWSAVVQLLHLAELTSFLGNTLYLTMRWIYLVYSLVLHVFLLISIAAFSKELQFLPTQSGAWRNLVTAGLYYLTYLFLCIPASAIVSIRTYFMIPLKILRIVFVILNVYLIFQCYRNIAPEGESQTMGLLPQEPKNKK